MKKYVLLAALGFIFFKNATAQIICIYCYEQNDSISSGINNLILNGGFENTTCIPGNFSSIFCPNSIQYSCDITGWTCTGGGSNTYSRIENNIFSIIPEGALAPYLGNYFCKACSVNSDDTSCLNNIFCTASGNPAGYPVNDTSFGGIAGVSLEQTVTGLITGNIYVLEFWVGGEPLAIASVGNGLFAVDVGFGDTLMREKATEPIAGIGNRYIIEFIATSSSHTIKFTNWGHICGDCTELVLDDVRLYTLAELSSSVPHCTVGIDNPDFQNEENIFPNPFANELNVKMNSNELSEIILYDIASRKLLQQKFTNSVSVNTELFSKGLYLYEVRNKNGVIKKGKVVKE